MIRWKDPLPTPFAHRCRIFPFKGMRQNIVATAVRDVVVIHEPHPRQVFTQVAGEALGHNEAASCYEAVARPRQISPCLEELGGRAQQAEISAASQPKPKRLHNTSATGRAIVRAQARVSPLRKDWGDGGRSFKICCICSTQLSRRRGHYRFQRCSVKESELAKRTLGEDSSSASFTCGASHPMAKRLPDAGLSGLTN